MELKKPSHGGLLFVILNQVILSLGAVLIVVILARYTTPHTFGDIRYLIAVLTILSFLSLPGITTIINHQAQTLSRENLSSLVATQFRWGLSATIGAFAIAALHAIQGNFELARMFVIGGIFTPITNLYLVPGTILAGMQKFQLKTLVDTGVIVSILTSVAYATLHDMNATKIILYYFITQALATCIAFAIVFLLLKKKRKNCQPSILLAHATDGRKLTFLQVPFSLIPAVEKALVYLILGPTALAIFVIAALPAEHFKSAFRNLIQVYILPHFTHKSVPTLIHAFGIGIFILTCGTGALILFILFGMPLLFNEFDAARTFALILIFGLIPLPIHVVTIFWIAERKIKKLTGYTMIGICINIFCIVVGSFMAGLSGAVYGKICYEILLAGGLLHLDKRIYKDASL